MFGERFNSLSKPGPGLEWITFRGKGQRRVCRPGNKGITKNMMEKDLSAREIVKRLLNKEMNGGAKQKEEEEEERNEKDG